MKQSWKPWLTGIALVQLLVVGIHLAMLWPMPSEAERVATLLHEGMTDTRAREVVGSRPSLAVASPGGGEDVLPATTLTLYWRFADGSQLSVACGAYRLVRTIETSPAAPLPPLTRLRRALARILPFASE